MWQGITKTICKIAPLLSLESKLQQQIRTTYILKRRIPPLLHKKGYPPKKLKHRQYIYELIEDTNIRRSPDLEVILTTYVDGIGKAGDKVTLRPNFAYYNLLLPGLAIYASPENVDRFASIEQSQNDEHSSPTAQRTINILAGVSLSVIVNRENPWVLQPWHIKACFRKCGYIMPDEAITMPSKPIKGPDMSLEGKEFYVTVKVNNLEETKVRCILHHWSTNITDRIQYDKDFWKQQKGYIFEEDEPIIRALPSVQKHLSNSETM